MSLTITVRDVDPSDKSWLQREAKHLDVSMEELVRWLIHERREKTRTKDNPSEAFRRYFGPDCGVELPLRGRGDRPPRFETRRTFMADHSA